MISPEPNVDYAWFDPRGTVAFEGTRDRSESRLPIQDITVDPKTKAITVRLDPPYLLEEPSPLGFTQIVTPIRVGFISME